MSWSLKQEDTSVLDIIESQLISSQHQAAPLDKANKKLRLVEIVVVVSHNAIGTHSLRIRRVTGAQQASSNLDKAWNSLLKNMEHVLYLEENAIDGAVLTGTVYRELT